MYNSCRWVEGNAILGPAARDDLLVDVDVDVDVGMPPAAVVVDVVFEVGGAGAAMAVVPIIQGMTLGPIEMVDMLAL